MIAATAPLGQRQTKVLEFVVSHTRERGYAPSLTEIGKAVGLRSLSSVSWHLNALEHKGRLTRVGPRAYRFPTEPDAQPCCPTCGQPVQKGETNAVAD